jgi:DNA-binding GntR family transcriptional regulator
MSMISKKTRAESVYLSLHRAIIEQALVPGSKLPEDIIGAHFGVSRTIVRSAFARLAGEGLVDIRPKRTATVARPSLTEARHVFEVRRSLEREAVRLVAERWKPEFGSRLEGHVRSEARESRSGGSPSVSLRLAGEFHIVLAEMTGNPLLQRYVAEVASRCSLILAVHGRPHSPECGIDEHGEIIAALRSGDVKRATAVMDQHLGLVEKRALIREASAPPEEIGTVLSRYAKALAPPDGKTVVPLARNRSRQGKSA